jgi:transposase-like protein
VIHVIQDTFRYAARQHWDHISRDLKPIYTAVNAEQAQARLDDFANA